jgi:integrase/recombinase XerD
MELLWSTGIRRGEVARLETYSVDASRKTVTIVQGKGKQDRVVPVGVRALWWLSYYQREVRPQLLVNPHCKALFVALDGVEGLEVERHHQHSWRVYQSVRDSQMGSCHLFRHAMATQMLEKRCGPALDTGDAGHRSVESTQIYTQVSIRALAAVCLNASGGAAGAGR